MSAQLTANSPLLARRTLQATVPRLLLVALVAVLACLPLVHRSIGPVLPGATDSPAALQLLAVVLITAALAVTLDVVIGYVGLIPFGHGVYFALGAYLMAMTVRGGLGFWAAAALAVFATTVVALAVNALALRTSALGYSMVILAAAEIVATGVGRGFFDSGAEIGIQFAFDDVPGYFRGLDNTRNTYWVALALFLVVLSLCSWMTKTLNGRVWQAIRENPLRVAALGYNVRLYQLAATVFASGLAAVCGVGYAVVMGGADPGITQVMFSLGLVVMVVLGGRGLLWGAAIGAVVYTMLSARLPALAQAPMMSELPDVVRTPLTQPEFVLGVVFVGVILFFPQGLAGAFKQRRPGRATHAGKS